MTDKLNGYLAAAASAVLMGTLGVLVRQVSAGAQVVTLARLLLGAVFLAAFMALTGRIREIKGPLSLPLLLSGLFLALGILFYIKAIHHTTLANAAFLLYLAPLIATVLAYFFLRERLRPRNLVLLGTAFLGMLFILEFNFAFVRGDNWGYLYGILAGIFFSIYIVLNRMIRLEVPALTRAFYQFLSGSLVMLPFASLAPSPVSWPDFFWLAAIGFINGFLALTLFVLSLKYLEVYEYGTISYLEPITAAFLGWLILAEQMTLLQIAGGILILSGAWARLCTPGRRRPIPNPIRTGTPTGEIRCATGV